MSERKYAVIGHPIGHTMSPFIHRRLFDLAGLKGDYNIIDVPVTQGRYNNRKEIIITNY